MFNNHQPIVIYPNIKQFKKHKEARENVKL